MLAMSNGRCGKQARKKHKKHVRAALGGRATRRRPVAVASARQTSSIFAAPSSVIPSVR